MRRNREKIGPALIFMRLFLHLWFLPVLSITPSVLYQKTGIVALFRICLFTRKQPRVTNPTVTVRNEADFFGKKGVSADVFHHRLWKGLILSMSAPHSLRWSLSLPLHTSAFTCLSDYSQILQPVTNLQLTKCCRGMVSPLASFMLLQRLFKGLEYFSLRKDEISFS